MDRLTPEARSANMRAIGRKGTAPEMRVRRLLHAKGYRYRLNDRTLPGSPDLVFTSRKKAVFVHGCFWHAHDCGAGRLPKSREEYWKSKFDKNRARDAAVVEALSAMGWKSFVVWGCEVGDGDLLVIRLTEFLGAPRCDNAMRPAIAET